MLDRTQQPEISKFEDFSFDFPKPLKLSNGIDIYVINSGDQELNKIEFIFRGGIYEQDIPLQAMVASTMLMHGTVHHSSSEISEFFDFYGTIVNTGYIDNFTTVSVMSLNQNMEEILPMVHEIIYQPEFPEKEFELLREQIKGAYKNVRKRVKYISQVAASQLLMGDDHPSARDVYDSEIEAITRHDVKEFHNKWIRPENCVIVASGKVDAKLFAFIDKSFGCDRITSSMLDCKIIPSNPSDIHFKVVDKDDAMQSSVVFLQNSIMRNHPDYIKLRIVITALGGYFGSRLMKNIREEKGYTYSIGASLLCTKNLSYINISSECDTAYTAELIKEVKIEIEKLRAQEMDNEELSTLKNCMLSDLVKILDTPLSMAGLVTSHLFYSTGTDYFNKQREIIENITAKDIKEIAFKYLNIDNFYIVVAGNEKLMKLESL